MGPRATSAALGALFLLAAAWRAGGFPLTPDEGRYVLEFSRGWRPLVEWLATDNHPPLYFLLLKGWTDVLGTSEWALRLPAALCGAATVAMLHTFLHGALGPRRAFVYTLLVACNPLFLMVHRLGKYYGALGLLALLALGLMLALLYRRAEAPVPRGRLAAWGGCCLVLLWTHYLAVPMIAAMGLWLLWERLRHRNPRAAPMLATLAAAAVGFLPWVPVVLSRVGSGEGHPAIAALSMARRLLVRTGYSAYAFAFGPTLELTRALLYGPGLLLVLAALGAGIYAIARPGGNAPRDARAILFFGAFAGVASLALMAVFLPGHPDLSMPERLAFLLPLVVLVAARGAECWPAWLRRVALAAWAVPAGVSVWNVYTWRENNSWDYLVPWHAIAARVEEDATRPRTVLAIRREFAGLSWYYLRPGAEHFQEIDPMTDSGLADRLAPDLLSRGGSVFILRATRDATADKSIDAFTRDLARHLGPPCSTTPFVFESDAMRRLKERIRPGSPADSKLTLLQYCPDRLATPPN